MDRRQTIRFGGREIDGRFVFELTGGALALDLVNTRDERPRGGIERLTDYRRLLEWSEQSGLLTLDGVARLSALAETSPTIAAEVVAASHNLRELLFAIMRRTASSDAPTARQVRDLNAWRRRFAPVRELQPRPGGLAWREGDRAAQLDGMLPDVVASTITLLTDADMSSRLRVCAADDCDWVFLDSTRRRNRIWCDMSVCGNRAKARRHHSKRSSRGDDPGEDRRAATGG